MSSPQILRRLAPPQDDNLFCVARYTNYTVIPNEARDLTIGYESYYYNCVFLLFIGEIPHPAEFTLSPKSERAGIRDDN